MHESMRHSVETSFHWAAAGGEGGSPLLALLLSCAIPYPPFAILQRGDAKPDAPPCLQSIKKPGLHAQPGGCGADVEAALAASTVQHQLSAGFYILFMLHAFLPHGVVRLQLVFVANDLAIQLVYQLIDACLTISTNRNR